MDSHVNLNVSGCTIAMIWLYVKRTSNVAQRLECSPMARETWVQSQVESYQRL